VTRATRYTLFALVAALASVVALPLPLHAQGPGSGGLAPKYDAPKGFRPEAGITEQLGGQVPLDVTLRDENEKPITFGEAMAGRATILVPVYYRCPMLCTKVLNGLLEALRKMPPNFNAGEQFQVVAVSMDPLEHGNLAKDKKNAYLNGDPKTGQLGYGRPGGEAGWRFLTGTKENVNALLDSVGYRFEFDKMLKEYNHPSGIIILSPQGKVTRYFYGIGYDGDFEIAGEKVNLDGKLTQPTTTLRLSLMEAAEGKGGSLLDKITLLCYRYDALHQGYSLNVLRAVQIGGVITLLLVATGALLAFRREGLLRVALGRIGIFALLCVAVSGLGLGGSLLRSGHKEMAVGAFAFSLLSVIGVTVVLLRRGPTAGAEPPPVAGHEALPSGGTA